VPITHRYGHLQHRITIEVISLYGQAEVMISIVFTKIFIMIRNFEVSLDNVIFTVRYLGGAYLHIETEN